MQVVFDNVWVSLLLISAIGMWTAIIAAILKGD